MTPTLVGRWQTRIAMLGTIGVLISAIFVLVYRHEVFFWVLLWVLVFGLVWDVIYIFLQGFRWDRDWPAAFQVATGVVEGVVVYLFLTNPYFPVPGFPEVSVPPWLFALHYGSVWLVIFWWVQGPMRAIFPFWRFHGGRIVPAVGRSSGRDRADR